jgi:predicted GNAT superfamily acetyltransferase
MGFGGTMKGVGGRGAGWEIRDLTTQEEFEAVVRLQEEVWGEGFAERVPSAILGIAARLGGVVAGAFLEGEAEPVGFVFGLTGLEEGRPAHWSDMLAVREGARGLGLARALKLHQRSRLLGLGVTRMYWTFDPLEARNAHLNLNRLGVRVRTYVEEMYGTSTSPLHRGIGTDRFVALWEMDAPWVRALAGGEAAEAWAGTSMEAPEEASAGAEVALASRHRSPRPPRPRHPPPGSGRPPGPGGHPGPDPGTQGADPDLALAWRHATREALRHYLEGGWEVRALVAPPGRPTARYLLVREE